MRDSLLLQCFDGDNGSVTRVTVIGSSSSIEFFRFGFVGIQNRFVGAQTLAPSKEGRLFIIVSVEEIGLINLSLNLNEDERSEIVFSISNDLRLSTFDSRMFDPVLDVLCSSLEVVPANSFPLLCAMERFADVFNFDELHKTG